MFIFPGKLKQQSNGQASGNYLGSYGSSFNAAVGSSQYYGSGFTPTNTSSSGSGFNSTQQVSTTSSVIQLLSSCHFTLLLQIKTIVVFILFVDQITAIGKEMCV